MPLIKNKITRAITGNGKMYIVVLKRNYTTWIAGKAIPL